MSGILWVMRRPSDAEIYEKYAGELVRFATFLVGRDDAGDVVSAAVLGALGAKAWPEVANHRGYLYRAVLSQARTARRREARRYVYERRAAQPDGVCGLAELRPEVLGAVARLSPRQRAVVYLTYWDDLEPASVAVLLEISEGAVRRHLARAREHLRRLLDA